MACAPRTRILARFPPCVLASAIRGTRTGYGHVLPISQERKTTHITDMLGAIGAEECPLAKGDDVRFMNDVAMRLQDE